jgi:hypothetical protein
LTFFDGHLRHIRTRGTAVVVGLAVTGAIGVGLAVIWEAGPADASTMGRHSISVQYQCPLPFIGNYQVNAVASWVQPESVTVGAPLPTIPFTVTTPVQTVNTQAADIASIEISVVVSSVVIAPQGNIDIRVPLTMPRAYTPQSGTAYIVLSGNFPSLVFTRPGIAKVTVGQATSHITPRYGNGKTTYLGTITRTCTPASGPSGLVMSFRINPDARLSSASPTPSAAPKPRHTTDPRPSPVPTKPTPPSPSPSVIDSSGVKTGSGSLYLVAGTGVALITAGSGAIWLLRRRRRII